MLKKLFYIIILLSSCAPKSFLQKNSYLVGPQNKIRTDGVYYMARNEDTTELKAIGYLKFSVEGYFVQGFTKDINALTEKEFEESRSAKQKNYSYFLVRNDTLFQEIYNDYNRFWLFDVYKIIGSDILIYIGDTRKIGKKIKSPPSPWILKFKKFDL